jgi:phage I-like protein
MKKRFCNASAAAPQLAVQAGDETVVQLVPPGDWPQWDEDGKEFSQKCDEETFQRLLENFSAEVLVDADHASERGEARDTRAYAWIQALSLDEGGALCGRFKWTDIGAEAVSNRRYRFVSVCWACEEEKKGEWRPLKLVSVALTNTPNIPARPILNQESAGGASADQPENKETPNMDELKTLLGLAPETPDDEVIAKAVATLKANAEEKAEAEADAFAEENKDKVQDAAKLRDAYLRSPELAREIVANFKAPAPAPDPAPAKVVCDSTKAQAPVLAEKNALRDGLAKCRPGAERAAYVQAHAAEFAAEAAQ